MRLPVKYYSIKYFIIFLLAIFFILGLLRNVFSVGFDDVPQSYGSFVSISGLPDPPYTNGNYLWQPDVGCSGIPGYAYCGKAIFNGGVGAGCVALPGSGSGALLSPNPGYVWTLLASNSINYNDSCLSMGIYGANWIEPICGEPATCQSNEHYDYSSCSCQPNVCTGLCNEWSGKVMNQATCQCECQPFGVPFSGCCPAGSSENFSWCGCRDDIDSNIVVESIPVIACSENYLWSIDSCR